MYVSIQILQMWGIRGVTHPEAITLKLAAVLEGTIFELWELDSFIFTNHFNLVRVSVDPESIPGTVKVRNTPWVSG